MLLGSIILLFARLGTYSLWTDEASTAITSVGVWRTGDTSAWLDDHNLLTYREGLLLKNQRDRYTSPLQFYLAAPFIGLMGHTSFACRLPFALCGLGTIGLLLLWLWQKRASDTAWVAASVLLLGNASFFLFQRQCRYYALATFLSMLVAYLYCNWKGRRKTLWFLAVAMSALLASQYLDYAAAVGCLVVDYGIWGRRRRVIRGWDWVVLIAPQLITAALVCSVWNPIARAASVAAPITAATHPVAAAVARPWIFDYFRLFWWNLREMLACDFIVLPLLLICPVLCWLKRDQALVRGLVALMTFLAAITLFTSHPLPAVGNAEVRYLAPVLPLCVTVGILTVASLKDFRLTIRAVIYGVAAASMLLKGSAKAYFGELLHPATEPYTPVSRWIGQNVSQRATVYVCPDLCVSPTMWNAPKATYIWQLTDAQRADYPRLPAIYFKGQVAPDYLVGYGPYVAEVIEWIARFERQGIRYEAAASIPVYYKEMFRPELIWRSFKSIEPERDEQVYIFRRVH